METIKVLVVDDSSFARSLICETLSADSHIRIVGEAKDGRSAVELSMALKPDLITMDLTMPDMDGLEAIRQIMHRCPTPILVITSKADAQSGFSAIAAGALEIFDKANIANTNYDSLLYKVRFLANVKVIRHLQSFGITHLQNTSLPHASMVEVVGIASSTGGPKALSLLLSSLPSGFDRPIFIAQHIGKQFDQGLATFLQRTTQKNVVLAEDGMKISRTVVYIAPAGTHLTIKDNTIVLTLRKPQDIYV
ncbi:MAG: response regulator, partial [Spirochaetia bacterium]|nr:response regulator [Spirochaetia bacterium]